LPVKCKKRQAELCKAHYEKNKEIYKQRARLWTIAQAKKAKALIDRYKLYLGCKVCGYRRMASSLELHHLAGQEKDNHIGDMIHDGVSTKRLKAEVRKCVVLCANCHREFHAGLISLTDNSV
jgi:transcription elongation factor Elf1